MAASALGNDWRLELLSKPERLDRPDIIYLHDGLTVGRGGADVLLDSTTLTADGSRPLGDGMGRIHARICIKNDEIFLYCESLNKCRVEGRSAGLDDRNISPNQNAQLTEGCVVIFASRATRAEWRYVLRKAPAAAPPASAEAAEAQAAARAAAEA